jgi:hypothetical protein
MNVLLRKIILIALPFFIPLLSSCVTEDTQSNSVNGNFQALWQILDEHYCFFPEKSQTYNLDWNKEYTYYSEMLQPTMTDEQLFDVCARMLRDLRDGHVNLSSSFNTARFWDWYEKYPANFSDSIQRLYLGTDYYLTAGIKYRILDDNIGYIYCGSFDNSFGSGNLSAIFAKLAICSGVIVDVRNNEGGMLTSAQALAECFTNNTITGGYISHKTGKGHTDISSPEAIKLTPATGVRWQKKVVVLTNRRCYSAANSFVMYMKACPNVTIMGAQTGGGGGLPFSSELPNGWSLRFSACPMYDKDMNCVEFGIEPDVYVNMTQIDMARNVDTMIEAARTYLKN